MPRTGKAPLPLALLLCSAVAWAQPQTEFYQTVDRDTVGKEDAVRLTVVVSDPPQGAALRFPAPADFDVLSRSQSSQMSYTLGAGGAGVVKQVQKYVFVLRAKRTGRLLIPEAELVTSTKTLKTEAIKVVVKEGSLAPAPPKQPAQPQQSPFDPFAQLGGFDDDGDPFAGLMPQSAPANDSDLFIRASLDKEEVFVGEQVNLALVIYSRVDLASVDPVAMPKLEGFWVEDLDRPSQLAPEQKMVGGVPYRAYLVHRRALFPTHPGKISISAAEVNITTGIFFNGRRVRRASNALTLEVKPLPPGGTPAANVGRWRLATEANTTQVALGEPINLKVIIEGRGNLKNVKTPVLAPVPGLKFYEPEVADKPSTTRGVVAGKRVVQYVILPQQTGAFTLPGLQLDYFNPETRTWEVSKTDPIALRVVPGAQNQQAIGPSGQAQAAVDPSSKNRLEAGGLKPLRVQAAFSAPPVPLHTRPWFLPLTLAPLGLSFALGLLAFARGALARPDSETEKKRKAKAAHARLAAAEKILTSGKTGDFYAELEKGVLGFLEAKLSQPVAGLTRDQLSALLQNAGVAEATRLQVLQVLEQSDMGRFAPGMGEASARHQALEAAVAAIAGWES